MYMYTHTHTHTLVFTHTQIQGRNPSVLVTQDIGEDLSDRFDESSVSVELPPCELSKLNDIFELVTSAIPSTVQRESLALAIEKEGYIAKLLDLFHVCEDLENTEGLHYIYKIFRTIFLLNKPSLLGMMFADDTIMDVIGCLEYDPAKPHPVRHREYLKKISQHREVIPFNNPQLLAKIHQVNGAADWAVVFVLIIQGIFIPTYNVWAGLYWGRGTRGRAQTANNINCTPKSISKFLWGSLPPQTL